MTIPSKSKCKVTFIVYVDDLIHAIYVENRMVYIKSDGNPYINDNTARGGKRLIVSEQNEYIRRMYIRKVARL